ncbi:uncharacterized protein LOC108111931 [Drosophila eugracilis]|uniref:uncharacterized protein LOC108111931 n=1 Tax=Drosophila eugracilis TaxID=29029 RepID=UPI001BD9697A|nr:uncharacterized protein LOC108111931 [Drosophila eugracilis]
MSDTEENEEADRMDGSTGAMPGTIFSAISILRPITTSRPDLSNAPSIVISLPDSQRGSIPEETPEQRLRRRMRFLELRREHYNHLHHSEQCNMTSTDDEDHSPNPPKSLAENKPK